MLSLFRMYLCKSLDHYNGHQNVFNLHSTEECSAYCQNLPFSSVTEILLSTFLVRGSYFLGLHYEWKMFLKMSVHTCVNILWTCAYIQIHTLYVFLFHKNYSNSLSILHVFYISFLPLFACFHCSVCVVSPDHLRYFVSIILITLFYLQATLLQNLVISCYLSCS
jgi:hypothetical protein